MLSRKERQALQKKEQHTSQEPKKEAEHQISSKEARSRKIMLGIIAGVAAIVVLAISWGAYSYFSPGYLDDFARCLSEKGATMYGAMDWCEYTQGQKAMFGKSFRYVDYEEHTKYPAGQYGDIRKTPTWIIDGEPYENTRSLKELSELTGCQLPS